MIDLQHLRNREARHVARHAGLRHAPGGDASQVTSLVVARVGGGHVGRGLVAGDGLELHLGKFLRHLQRGLHVAEAGREDDAVALAGQVANDALGVGAFGHVLDKGGLHARAQRGLDGLAALVVLLGPPGVGDRRDIDKTGLDGLAGGWPGLGKNGE